MVGPTVGADYFAEIDERLTYLKRAQGLFVWLSIGGFCLDLDC